MGNLAKKTAWILYLVFTVLIVGSLSYNIYEQHHDALDRARDQVRLVVENDLIYRHWAASVGGLYVPVSDDYRPNPFLKVPHRDLETVDGTTLTLINPAYMTRKVNEMKRTRLSLGGHLTSLDPINPHNAPTPWEKEALEKLAADPGLKEIFMTAEVAGERWVRYIVPLVVEPACLKCHAGQGYTAGGLRGAVSAELPFETIHSAFIHNARVLLHSHAIFWLLGILAIRLGTRTISYSENRRDRAEKKLQEHIEQQEKLIAERTDGLRRSNKLLIEEIDVRVAAEEKIREARDGYEALSRQFFTLLKSIPDHIYVIEPDCRIAWKNRDFSEDSNAPPCCVAQGEIDIARRCERCNIARTFETRAKQSFELQRAGQVWKFRTFPVTNDRDEVEHVILSAEDVTGKVRARQENLHVAQLASLGELAASVAHEINNPVNGIINLAEVLRQRTGGLGAVGDIPDRIIREGERVAEIVRNLLNLSRKDMEPRRERVCTILAEVLSVSRKGLYHDGIDIDVDCAHDLPLLAVTGQQIHQIVLNLLTNSRHAFAERTAGDDRNKLIRISCRQRQDTAGASIALTVWDNATGIAADTLPHVMAPFYTTKAEGVGTGLGLSICKDIAEKHGGSITVDSVAGEYTEVTVILPCQP